MRRFGKKTRSRYRKSKRSKKYRISRGGIRL